MKEVISKKEMGVSRYSSFILGLLFLVIQGCAGVGPDLEKAKEQNTEQAYLAFIEKYQDQYAASEQIKEARKAIILIKFTEAQKKNTLEGYDLFVDLYNKDPLAEQQLLQANQLSETLIFEQCRINKDPKDFRKYVARFTENPPVPENLVTVKNWLRFHDINQAKKQDSLITYSTFLSN